MPLKQYDAVRLKPEIQQTLHDEAAIEDHSDRTPERDKAAAWLIHSDAVDLDDWGNVLMTELEELSNEERDGDGWSRQHFANVISDYMEGVPQHDDTHDRRAAGRAPPRDRSASQNSSPMSAAPDDLDPQARPELAAGEDTVVVFVEDGRVQRVSEVPIPDDIDDLETYLQGVLAGAGSL